MKKEEKLKELREQKQKEEKGIADTCNRFIGINRRLGSEN